MPRFGSRPLSDLQYPFQILAGLYGPPLLTRHRENPGRQRYPEYVGSVGRNEWLGRKLEQLGADFYKKKSADQTLIEQRRSTLDSLYAAEQLALWNSIASFLNGHAPSLRIEREDARTLSGALQKYAVRDRIDREGVLIRQFAILGLGWRFDPPRESNLRRVAAWKVLFDELEVRGHYTLMSDATAFDAAAFEAIFDLDPDREPDDRPNDAPDADDA